MNRAFVIMAALLLSPLPAFAQAAPRDDDRGSSDLESGLEDILREIGDHGRRGGRGAIFFVRGADRTVAVRCDPQDSMKECVDATLTLIDRTRGTQSSGGAPTSSPGEPTPTR